MIWYTKLKMINDSKSDLQIPEDILKFNAEIDSDDYRLICERLAESITLNLSFTESKVWHGSPVWFIDGNPIVGYSIQKPGVRLMFWSGVDFDEPDLKPGNGKFKDASIIYKNISEIDFNDLKLWLQKSEKIQWDYKNIVKRKGELVRLK